MSVLLVPAMEANRSAASSSRTGAFPLLAPVPVGVPPAFAHGLGQSYDLPLPLWLYLFGAGATVLVSFVLIILFGRHYGDRQPLRYAGFDLLRIRPLRAVLTARAFQVALRVLSVALFLLVILSGLLGRQAPTHNFAPTFVWIVWWVGLSFFTAFVGNVWPLLNPWKILFEWAEGLAGRLKASGGLGPHKPYPAGWGVWPAVLLYAAFTWVELVFAGWSTPSNVATLALSYSVLTWGGMVVYGKDAWVRSGDAFSVYFDLLARFAPTEARVKSGAISRHCAGDRTTAESAASEDPELCLRPFAVVLCRLDPPAPDRMVFVVLVLAGVTYDGLLATPLWLELVRLTPVSQTTGLFALLLFFLAVYLAFIWLSRFSGAGGAGPGRLAAAYVYSLLPIAIAYQVAHYFTYLLVQGQAIISHLSDPFGWGWNLFGTAGYDVRVGIVGAAFVWYSQVTLIVAGHVVAVYVAHEISLRLLQDPWRALRSQLPMLALMILYTVSTLWILSRPIVE
jgi:hypothetical protein